MSKGWRGRAARDLGARGAAGGTSCTTAHGASKVWAISVLRRKMQPEAEPASIQWVRKGRSRKSLRQGGTSPVTWEAQSPGMRLVAGPARQQAPARCTTAQVWKPACLADGCQSPPASQLARPPACVSATCAPGERAAPASPRAGPHTRRICALLPKQMASQSGCAALHCSWLIWAPALYARMGSRPAPPPAKGGRPKQ